jgi:hypothetical protein
MQNQSFTQCENTKENIMSTSKKSSKAANASKAIQKANENAVTGFPAKKVEQALHIMGDTTGQLNVAKTDRTAAGFNVVKLAAEFAAAAHGKGIPTDTIVSAWRDNVAIIVLKLAVAGNEFCDLKPAKGDKAATAKLTGYGNNVFSTARGVVEFELEVSDSYRETERNVKIARESARRKADPARAQFNDAKANCRETWTQLRDLVFATNNADNVDDLTALLQDTLNSVSEQIAEAAKAEEAKLEERAEAAKAA